MDVTAKCIENKVIKYLPRRKDDNLKMKEIKVEKSYEKKKLKGELIRGLLSATCRYSKEIGFKSFKSLFTFSSY